jgi:hypothetical protein
MEKPFERLRQARIAAGFKSASAAARQFGWGEAAYRHHENGTRSYGVDQAQQYGEAFKTSAIWLLDIGMSASDSYRLPLGKFYAEAIRPEITWRPGAEDVVNSAYEALNLMFVPELEIGTNSVEVARGTEGEARFHLISPDAVDISAKSFTSGFIFASRAPRICPRALMREGDLILADSSRGDIGPEVELWLIRDEEEVSICYASRPDNDQPVALSPHDPLRGSFLTSQVNVMGKVLWVGRRI